MLQLVKSIDRRAVSSRFSSRDSDHHRVYAIAHQHSGCITVARFNHITYVHARTKPYANSCANSNPYALFGRGKPPGRSGD